MRATSGTFAARGPSPSIILKKPWNLTPSALNRKLIWPHYSFKMEKPLGHANLWNPSSRWIRRMRMQTFSCAASSNDRIYFIYESLDQRRAQNLPFAFDDPKNPRLPGKNSREFREERRNLFFAAHDAPKEEGALRGRSAVRRGGAQVPRSPGDP